MAGTGVDPRRRVRLLPRGRALLAAAIVALTIPVASASADASSDIPGIPLPGSVATGQLGGPIYDVVYQFVVSPGSLLVASLTGTAGTDFDMYLFDSTATTVLQKTGLVAQSTGPTSTELISYASPAGGTYYIDLNGSTDIEGTFRLVVQAVADKTPPSVTSLTLGDASGSANSLTVNVTLAATDDLSGLAGMAFSLDGTSWTAWTPYAKSSSWTFEGEDGTHTLWAKVQNGVGLESAPLAASVRIDTVPPHAIRFDPAPGAQVEGLRPRLTVQFDEPISVASWQNLGLVVQSSGG
ncbi:MAG: PPC domain-containing protein, partial [Actinomycetes bacterium]